MPSLFTKLIIVLLSGGYKIFSKLTSTTLFALFLTSARVMRGRLSRYIVFVPSTGPSTSSGTAQGPRGDALTGSAIAGSGTVDSGWSLSLSKGPPTIRLTDLAVSDKLPIFALSKYTIKKELIMENENIYYAVNKYLVDWDPINLPHEIANVEYVSYVPRIVEALSDKEMLCSCLISFLGDLGISQDNARVDLVEEVSSRADELMRLKAACRSHDVFIKCWDSTRKTCSSLHKIFSRLLSSVGFSVRSAEDIRYKVHLWYISYSERDGHACREIGMGKDGTVIKKASYEDHHGYWFGSHFTINDYVKRFSTEFISKEEFESVWNEGN